MSAATFTAEAAVFARRLEDREGQRSGLKLPDARAAVARRSGVSTSIFDNLRRGRLKSVAADVHHALMRALIADLEAEIARAQHELDILRAAPQHVGREQIQEVEEGLETLWRLLRNTA